MVIWLHFLFCNFFTFNAKKSHVFIANHGRKNILPAK